MNIIQTVIDGNNAGYSDVKRIERLKAEYHEKAVQFQKDSNADHAVYCNISYNADGSMSWARFYTNFSLDETEFDKRTRNSGDNFIGAVHRRV
jgi:hypothetical protein